MSKYSDHTTTGGQVIAHRFRMMAQNWNIIGIVGRISFLFSFFFYLMLKWTICDIWNYLCIVKAVYRDKMITLPSTLFSHSYFWFNNGHCKWISDYVVARHNGFLAAKDQFENFLWLDLKISIAVCIGAMLLIRLVKHASTGAIRGNGLSYVSSKNYVAKANGAFVDIPSVCCRTVISGARDVTYNLNDVRALSASERGPRLHSEIAFLQDLTGVCDPARQNPTTDSILVNILRDIQSSLSEGNENFNLEILIKNSRNNPCTSTEFIGDLGMDCQSYLRLFCEKVNNYDLFQQVTRCVCKIYVQAPSGVTCIQ